MIENKLCLFLKQEVIHHESQAFDYEAYKRRRIEIWKKSEQTQKKQKKIDEKILKIIFIETVQSLVINNYVSAII